MESHQQSGHLTPGTKPNEARERLQTDHALAANVAKFPGIIGTFMGRDALSLAILSLHLDAQDTVLLPVYTCQEVLKSLVGRVRVVFYDLQPDLSIDPDEIRKKLKHGRFRMVLITDYFGFLQPYRREIRQICDEKDICLVEDCAHSLLTEGAGELGDFAVYSIRKILPLLDGGGLRINRKCINSAPKFFPRIYSDALSLTALAKARLNIHTEMFSRARVASHTSRVVSAVTTHKENERILPLSYFARHGIARVSLAEVERKRREDFQFWSEISLENTSIIPVFPKLPPNVCPLGFPVRVKERASIEARAKKAGIVLSVHWRLDALLGPECTSSHQISKQLLTLPVYPHLGGKKREILAGVLAEEAKLHA